MFDQLRLRLLQRLSRIQDRARELDQEPAGDVDLMASGSAMIRAGRFVEAEGVFRSLLASQPNDAKVLVNLGFALKEQGRLAESRVYLQRALLLNAGDPPTHEIHYLFGNVAEEQGQLEEAAGHFEKAFRLKPDFEHACKDCCRLLFLTGRIDEARAVLDIGLQANPDSAVCHFFQGNLHLESQALEAAVRSYQRALDLGANDAAVYSSLGTVLYRLGDVDAAMDNFRRAEQREPGCIFQLQFDSGCAYFKAGELPLAIANFEMALKFRPDALAAHNMLLSSLTFGSHDPASYRDAALRYGAVVSAQAGQAQRPPKAPYAPSARALKVGFVSGDLKAHPVGFFLEGILAQLDTRRIQAIAYSNNADDDAVSARLKPRFAQWHNIRELDDDAAARLVHSHGIDILVDLAGHTRENRLPVFARRPAPVQATWLGYFASTGVAEIDYILADDTSVPEDTEEFFSEQVWRLPDTRLCLTPPALDPPIPVAAPPSLERGVVTFGSFQARAKISVRVLATWSRVLAAVPGARLRLQIPQIDAPGQTEALMGQLQRAGVEPQRVQILPGVPWQHYLQAYAEVDILLDTFPYPGGTTTAEALWMGVPTVTLAGSTMLSRQGACMLACAGLPDWVARDEDDYVAKAVGFAGQPAALGTLRAELRQRAARSPLFDTRRFAAHLQDALESMYQASPRSDGGSA